MQKGKYTKWRNNTLIARIETDKKYMILKMGNYLVTTAGLGWYILYTLQGIRFAIENDFIPIVDWRSFKIPQYDPEKVGKENVWEYFFEQPFNIDLEQAYKSEDFFVIDDVRTVNGNHILDVKKFVDFYDKDIMEWRRYFHTYVRLNKDIKEYFNNCISQQIHDEVNLIGILARGTDYEKLKPMGHLKTIYKDKLFLYVDKLMSKADENRIFLATEDEIILKNFEKRYPGKVNYVDTKRYKETGHNTLNIIYTKENGYERDLKYLYALYVISKCPMCIYSACGGGILASLMRTDSGISYNYLYQGYNRPNGMIVGSYREKEAGRMIYMGGKPMMFYALNTLKLLNIEDVYIIISNMVKNEYQRLIGDGEKFGMRIKYIISDTYNVVESMICHSDFMETSKTVLLYTDFFVHGVNVVKELSEKINTFDGAYVWGVKNLFANNTESIKISKMRKVPKEAFICYKTGNYSLVGRYIFDFELKDIIRLIAEKKENLGIIDILNGYISRKKLFFEEYKRGTVYSKVEDEESLVKTGQMIDLMEQLQNEKIGNFEMFRK